MTEYEARKLSESMHKELNAGPRAVWQCIAGLVIVISLMVAGTAFDLSPNGSSDVARVHELDQTLVSRNNLDVQSPAYIEPEETAHNLVPVAGASARDIR